MNLRFAAWLDVKREEQTEPFEPGRRADQEHWESVEALQPVWRNTSREHGKNTASDDSNIFKL